MTDIRQHRGPHPKDRKLFAAEQLPALRTAIAELSWLLTRGYAIRAALKLVADRHSLADRQRLAISRAACSDQSQEQRTATSVRTRAIAGEELLIDGFNLIITIEAALSGGMLMLCRDGCIRDLSSVYGSYRSVIETDKAIRLIGNALRTFRPKSVAWLLDRPISNSGRLAKRIRGLANERGWPWSVETVFNPDREIVASDKIVISSDGPLLDRVQRWVNFNRYLVESRKGQPWLIDLN